MMPRRMFNSADFFKKRGALYNKLARVALGLGGAKLVSLFFGFGISVIMARGLGVESYGVYSYVLGLILLCGFPATAGLPSLLIRETSRYRHNRSYGLLTGLVWRAHQFVIVTASLMVIGIAMLSIYKLSKGGEHSWELIALAALIIPISALTGVRAAILTGLSQVLRAQLPQLLVQPGVFLAAILCFYTADNLTPITAIIANIFSVAISLALLTFLLKQHFSRFSTGRKRLYSDAAWLRAIVPFSAIAGVSMLNAQLMIPVVGMLATESDVAYFKIAMSLAMIAAAPLAIVESTIHSHVTWLYQSGDLRGMFKIVGGGGRAAFVVALPIGIGLILFGDTILSNFYGPAFSGATTALSIMVCGYLLNNLIGPSMLLLHATRYEKDAFLISAGGAGLTLILSFALIPDYGAEGGAYAFTIAKITRAAAFRVWAHYRMGRTSNRKKCPPKDLQRSIDEN